MRTLSQWAFAVLYLSGVVLLSGCAKESGCHYRCTSQSNCNYFQNISEKDCTTEAEKACARGHKQGIYGPGVEKLFWGDSLPKWCPKK